MGSSSNNNKKRAVTSRRRNSNQRTGSQQNKLPEEGKRTPSKRNGKLRTGQERRSKDNKEDKDPTIENDKIEDEVRKEENKEQPPAEKDKDKKELRGRKAPPHFKPGTLLNNRIKVERLMGGGGFGQVFKAVDTHHEDREVAVKVEPTDKESGRMILEQKVLNLLRGTKHAPLLIASGTHDNYMYIVMEYLGRNLNDLRRRMPKRRFTPQSTIRSCIQMVSALNAVHHIGYLHRDVKPSNMCVGHGDVRARRNVFLVDFGMTRKYMNEAGTRRKERQYAGFRGTLRYVSITVHERREQGPCDDLWSLLYSMIELGEGALPWRHIEDDEDMSLKKKKTPIGEMLMHLPKDFKQFAEHLQSLTYDSTPNYDLLISTCKKGLPADINDDSPLDWDGTVVNSQSLERDSE
ncbi:unnamed protein product [Bursaphelenchus okinawaensis]|uniref:non-specific serine/threonine protein kinase n=1 Tax=Bursaphelenchus okinawaensis TaxID=465554 RepID=A0A811LT84_9BILA|nr:unnamed protein product [Bursaphelenchus okinawaensis]CAG9128151.1 unnamed protein product [Bursaphelenchus okinawaensis]